jgi:SAM-dependent methyltransferase
VQSVGPSFPALGWYTPETQRARFEVFTLLGDFSASQVLDAGCGLGDLFRFLKEKHYDGLSYTGLDVMADFIAQARHRYQQHGEARFFQQSWTDGRGHRRLARSLRLRRAAIAVFYGAGPPGSGS